MAELLRIEFNAAKAAKQLGIFVGQQQRVFTIAARQAMDAAAKEIHGRSERDILRAGNFSERWPAALAVHNQGTGSVVAMTVGFRSSIPYAHVHEFGATIRGKPLLWIPLSFADVPTVGPGSAKMSARNYPGGLFRVNRVGRNPLLFSKVDKRPKYVGVVQVILRPRFHIRSIVANVVRTQLARLFSNYVKGVK